MQEKYDVAEFLVKNKAVIVQDLTPMIKHHLTQLPLLSDEEWENSFIRLVTNAVARKLSEETGLTIDVVSAIVDMDFLTSITGDYFFSPEKYEYSNQN